jgi:hypothetical protein
MTIAIFDVTRLFWAEPMTIAISDVTRPFWAEPVLS